MNTGSACLRRAKAKAAGLSAAVHSAPASPARPSGHAAAAHSSCRRGMLTTKAAGWAGALGAAAASGCAGLLKSQSSICGWVHIRVLYFPRMGAFALMDLCRPRLAECA